MPIPKVTEQYYAMSGSFRTSGTPERHTLLKVLRGGK